MESSDRKASAFRMGSVGLKLDGHSCTFGVVHPHLICIGLQRTRIAFMLLTCAMIHSFALLEPANRGPPIPLYRGVLRGAHHIVPLKEGVNV